MDRLVSIYLPTRNRRQLLERAVASVLSQTYRNIELIVVNDGSTDDTSLFLKRISQSDRRIIPIDNPRSLGPSPSRNIAVRAAKGFFVSGLDDDEFTPDRISKFVEYWNVLAAASSTHVCLFSQSVFVNELSKTIPIGRKQIMELIVFIVFLTRSSVDAVFGALPIEVGGLSMTAGAILNLVVLGLAGMMTLLRTGSNFPFKVWLPFLFVAALSVAWASDKGLAIRMLLVLVTYAGLFAIPFYMRKKFRSDVWLLKAIIYSSILPATVGLLEYFYFLNSTGRVQSTFDHPNVFALPRRREACWSFPPKS